MLCAPYPLIVIIQGVWVAFMELDSCGCEIGQIADVFLLQH